MPSVIGTGEMRALEARAIASGAVTGLGLMERAGQGVVAALLEAWPDLAAGAHRALVLAGPGNNGGDGYVVARLLHGRGWRVRVLALGDPARLPPDAAANRARWLALGPAGPLTEAEVAAALAERPEVIVDALFGIGLARPLEGLAAVAQATAPPAAARPWRVVAVDVPSGLDADTGRPLLAPGQPPIRADLTVTFHAPKPGHLAGDGPALCGRLAVVDIGLPRPSSSG